MIVLKYLVLILIGGIDKIGENIGSWLVMITKSANKIGSNAVMIKDSGITNLKHTYT